MRKKDVKVNGKRINENLKLNSNDELVVYVASDTKNIKIYYEDENLLVAFKPRMIETAKLDSSNSFQATLEKLLMIELFAVHRLDRNTSGLVVFAKNQKAKTELDLAFKNRTIHKFYLAEIIGRLNSPTQTLKAYLKKDAQNAKVIISNEKLDGYSEIITKFTEVKNLGETSIVEVELITGKTHQIRAHLAFISHPIIGDEKYGVSAINKKFKRKFQSLTAYKFIFNFKTEMLSYLNGKVIELNCEDIDFLSNNK